MKKVLLLSVVAALAFGADMQVNTINPQNLKGLNQEFKAEIVFAKKMEVDCNYHFLLGGQLDEKYSSELGSYYEFSGSDEAATTMMRCPPDEKKQIKEVEYGFRPVLSFESKTGIKILAPKDVIVKYKIYQKIIDDRASKN